MPFGHRLSRPLSKPPYAANASPETLRWTQPGMLTKPSRRITDFVHSNIGRLPSRPGGPTLLQIHRFVRSAIKSIKKFRVVEANEKKLHRNYAKRSASEIITSGKIFVANEHVVRNTPYWVGGCVDYATALAAILRSERIPAMYVRQLNHSSVFFFSHGKWFEADAMNDKPVHALSPSQQRALDAAIGARRLRKIGFGRDSHDLNVKGLLAFGKYRPHP